MAVLRIKVYGASADITLCPEIDNWYLKFAYIGLWSVQEGDLAIRRHKI